MLKSYLFGISLMLVATLSAQPIFENPNCFHIGVSGSIGFGIDNATYSYRLAQNANNSNWDFSSNTWTAPVALYGFRPASESIHSVFANSQINELAEMTYYRDFFFSYDVGGALLYLDGAYTGGNSYQYQPSIPYLSFPLHLGDSVFYHANQFANPNLPDQKTGAVIRSWKYDGYGTLTLPYGTPRSCYRLHTLQTDSVSTIAIGTYDELLWFDAETSMLLLRLVGSADIGVAYYASNDAPSGIPAVSSNAVSIYPNPSTGDFSLQFENGMNAKQVELFQLTGQRIVIQPSSSNTYNTSNLSAGYYRVRVTTSSGNIYNLPFVKQ